MYIFSSHLLSCENLKLCNLNDGNVLKPETVFF